MNTIAVITGASSGLGAEFARQITGFAGVDEVWLVARRQDRLEALARDLTPARTRVLALDLATEGGMAGLEAALDEARNQGHRLGVLVNNAGFGTYGPFAETLRDWQLDMVNLNVTTLTRLSWYAARNLGAGGHLINVASLAGFQPLGNFAAYAATKAYVLSLSAALGAELEGRGIKVTALCPGPVETEFGEVASGGKRKVVVHAKKATPVVAHCLRVAKSRRAVAVHGLDWKFQAFLSRILGRRFVSRLTWKFMPRPQDEKNRL